MAHSLLKFGRSFTNSCRRFSKALSLHELEDVPDENIYHIHTLDYIKNYELTPSRKFIKTSKYWLNVDSIGFGHHPIVCIANFLGGASTDFHQQIVDNKWVFDRQRFTTFGIDPIGLGYSVPPVRDWPLDFYQRDADDIAEVLQKLSITNATVLGWGDGATTAIKIAARYPEIVDRMVLWSGKTYLTKEDILRVKEYKPFDWKRRNWEPLQFCLTHIYLDEHYHRYIHAMERYLSNTGGDICSNDLDLVQCPVLVIHGTFDPFTDFSHAKFIHKYIKDSRLLTLHFKRHDPHIASPKMFNKMVEDFIKTC